MKTFEKLIKVFSKVIIKNLNVGDVSYWLYKKIKNMSVEELAEYLISEYQDIEPKKLTKGQKAELKYFLNCRKKTIMSNINDKWLIDNVELVEDYSNLDKNQSYDIQKLLNDDEGILSFIDYLSFKKHRIETGILPTNELNFEINLHGISDISQIINRTILGVRDTTTINRFTHIIDKDGNILIDIGVKRNTFKYDLNKLVNKNFKIKLENKIYSIQIEDEVPEVLGKCDFTTFNSEKSLIIGGLKTGDTIGSWSEFWLLGIKLWNKDFSMELKPAYDLSGNLSLYDTISENYYALIDENVIPIVEE